MENDFLKNEKILNTRIWGGEANATLAHKVARMARKGYDMSYIRMAILTALVFMMQSQRALAYNLGSGEELDDEKMSAAKISDGSEEIAVNAYLLGETEVLKVARTNLRFSHDEKKMCLLSCPTNFNFSYKTSVYVKKDDGSIDEVEINADMTKRESDNQNDDEKFDTEETGVVGTC